MNTWGIIYRIYISCCLIVVLYFAIRKRDEQYKVRHIKLSGILPSSLLIPVTPEPNYICKNCGMLIVSGHGHTETECGEYLNDPTKPDLIANRPYLDPGLEYRNPPVRLPNYYEEGKFRSWNK